MAKNTQSVEPNIADLVNGWLKSYNLDEQIRYQLAILDGLDAFTRKHCEHVANLTCRLCEYLHCQKGFIEYCTICAYLHDIGKLEEFETSSLGKAEYTQKGNLFGHHLLGYELVRKFILKLK